MSPSDTSGRPHDHPPVLAGKIGVLLVNLGTPDAPTASAVRRYLAEFLSDRRVVELSPLLWQPILRGIILNTRPKRVARAYAHIWDKQHNASPLRVITVAQAEALKGQWGDKVIVEHAMRYGTPSLGTGLERLAAQGCDRLLIAPLYPQYSQATTGTVLAAAFVHLSRQRWMPALRTLPPYHDDPAYIDALAVSVRTHLATLKFRPDALLASFHGMPQVTLAKGDPYHCQCQKTARLLAAALAPEALPLRLAFQSRFGRQEWLRPYAVDAVRELAQSGVRRLVVLAPGFSADCLETLEEIQSELKTAFMAAGGAEFSYCPCLNDSAPGVEMLRCIIGRELEGWSGYPHGVQQF